MSSLAQEEGRSISENITWSKRKQAAEGRVTFAYNNVLGFKPKEDGGFEVDKEQARIVRYIFGKFLSGKNPNQIAKHLTENKIPTPRGKEKWSYSSVRSILTNEKYKGDALLQKYYKHQNINLYHSVESSLRSQPYRSSFLSLSILTKYYLMCSET